MSGPQPGDIGLVKIKGNVGLAIELGEWFYDHAAHESHAFLYLGDGHILEAEPGGARIATTDEYSARDILWSTVERTPEQRVAIVRAAVPMQGIPYNWENYAYLALARFGMHDDWLRTRINDGKHLMCSQLCDAAYLAAGIHLFDDGRLPGDVTPGDLAKLVEDGKL